MVYHKCGTVAVKTLDGKVYDHHFTYKTKKEADEVIKRFRRRGIPARSFRHSYGYEVYRRRKK